MLDDKDDGLDAARGLFWGFVLSAPIWGLVFYILW
jgi:hypothetical protein